MTHRGRRHRAARPSDPTLPVADRARARVLRARRLRRAALDGAARARPRRSARCTRSAPALVAMLGLLARRAAARAGARTAPPRPSAVVALALALLGGGVADELLRPDRWGELSSGIGRGIESLPGVRVPYRGVDEWTRTVIPLGGTVLVARRRRCSRSGRARGAHRLPGRRARACSSRCTRSRPSRSTSRTSSCAAPRSRCSCSRSCGSRSCGVGDAGNAGAGGRRRGRAGADARARARPRRSRGGTTRPGRSAPPRRGRPRSRWDHDYGPLDWPRDGRELLRVKAERRPRTGRRRTSTASTACAGARPTAGLRRPGTPERRGGARATARRTIRVDDPQPRAAARSSPPATPTRSTRRRSARRRAATGPGSPAATLRRGDAYTALVYTPQTERASSAASAGPPASRADLDALPRSCSLPGSGTAIGQTGAPAVQRSTFPQFGDTFNAGRGAGASGNPQAIAAGGRAARAARTARTAAAWALAQQLRGGAETQDDFVQAVLAYLRRGFTYSETPPRAAYNARRLPVRRQERLLPAVLGRDGAAAAHGRRARARRRPASRPARSTPRRASTWSATSTRTRGSRSGTAASAGSRSTRRPAAAPPRSQPNEAGASGGAGRRSAGPPSLGGDRAVRPRPPRGRAPTEGTPWGWIAARRRRGVLAAGRRGGRCSCAAAGAARHAAAGDRARRARARAAPHRAATPAPGTTLRALERRFARSPAAAGYVRAVRELRYGGGARRADARPAPRPARRAGPRRRPRPAACGRGGRCPPRTA